MYATSSTNIHFTINLHATAMTILLSSIAEDDPPVRSLIAQLTIYSPPQTVVSSPATSTATRTDPVPLFSPYRILLLSLLTLIASSNSRSTSAPYPPLHPQWTRSRRHVLPATRTAGASTSPTPSITKAPQPHLTPRPLRHPPHTRAPRRPNPRPLHPPPTRRPFQPPPPVPLDFPLRHSLHDRVHVPHRPVRVR